MYTLFAITGLKKIVPIPLLLEIPHYTGILVVLMKILVFRGIPDNRGNWIYLVKFQREIFFYLVLNKSITILLSKNYYLRVLMDMLWTKDKKSNIEKKKWWAALIRNNAILNKQKNILHHIMK